MEIIKESLIEKRKIVLSQKDAISAQLFKLEKELERVNADFNACNGALQILDILEKDLAAPAAAQNA